MNDEMTFGEAIEALKKDKRVARRGWNGKGMYLWLKQEIEIPKEWIKEKGLKEAIGDRDSIKGLASISMLTAQGEVLSGWLASQTDMLSEDWTVVG
jgi:hypothetical protein